MSQYKPHPPCLLFSKVPVVLQDIKCNKAANVYLLQLVLNISYLQRVCRIRFQSIFSLFLISQDVCAIIYV